MKRSKSYRVPNLTDIDLDADVGLVTRCV